MNSPLTGGKARLEREWQTMQFRKDDFRICYHYYVCEDTGEEFTDEELDTLNQNQVYNQYRAKYGIPFVDEIRRTREQYDLSATKMSEVLGLGTNVYRQYEAGEMPSVSTGRLISLASNAEKFEGLLILSKNLFDSRDYERVWKKVEHAKKAQTAESYFKHFWIFGSTEPDVYTGYRKPSIEKIGAMVKHFAGAAKPFTTAMNKLLFYADFGHFKRHGCSISGLHYKAIQKGPVPANYGRLYNEIVERKFVSVFEVVFNDFVGDKFCSAETNEDKQDLQNVFASSEIDMLNNITEWFLQMNCSTTRIVEASHDEKAWQENVDEFGRVSYAYSFDLKHK